MPALQMHPLSTKANAQMQQVNRNICPKVILQSKIGLSSTTVFLYLFHAEYSTRRRSTWALHSLNCAQRFKKKYIMGSNQDGKHLSCCSQTTFPPTQLKDYFIFLQVLTPSIFSFWEQHFC